MARQDEQTKVRQVDNGHDGKGIMMLMTMNAIGIGAYPKIPEFTNYSHNNSTSNSSTSHS